MLLCAISTSSAVASVALFRGETLLAALESPDRKLHAERLFSLIDGVLGSAGIAKAELSALACDVGPGSFTGVRVGLAAASGIVLGLGIRAIGVGALSSLGQLALTECEAESVLVAVDAQKGEVFFEQLTRVNVVQRGTLDRDAYREFAAVERGKGTQLVGSVHAELGFSPADFVSHAPNAVAIGRVALLASKRPMLGASTSEDPSVAFEPVYGRDADATPLSEQTGPFIRPRESV
jgi:tRNA threonylcarbamoyladenosine biosynthesis protein TsaB